MILLHFRATSFIGDEKFGQQQHNLYHCISNSSRHVIGNGGSTAQSSATLSGHSQLFYVKHFGNKFWYA